MMNRYRLTALAAISAITVAMAGNAKAGDYDYKWFGTAPICKGKCPSGWSQVRSSVAGDGATCLRGRKVLCRKPKATLGHAFCSDYANQAVRSAQIAREKRCAEVNSHEFWSSNYNAHYIWCRGLSTAAKAHAGTRQRNQLAMNCRRR